VVVEEIPSIEEHQAQSCPQYRKGTNVWYRDSTGALQRARILASHQDDSLEPYYSIRLPDGREKQTDNAHIRLSVEEFDTKDQNLVSIDFRAANEKSGKKPSLRGGGKRLARVSCSPSYGESDSDPDYSSDDDCYGTSRDDDCTDPCPLKDEWRTLEDGLCGQRTFLHQSGIKKFVHGGKEYTLPNTIDIRSDSSRDTLEFLAALTMSVFEFGLDERCILADFDRLHKRWTRKRHAVVRGDLIDSSLWVDDTWLMYDGMKFELRVKISLLIDNVFKEDRQYNPFAESVRVVEMTCNARGCTDSDDFVPYHFDAKYQHSVKQSLPLDELTGIKDAANEAGNEPCDHEGCDGSTFVSLRVESTHFCCTHITLLSQSFCCVDSQEGVHSCRDQEEELQVRQLS